MRMGTSISVEEIGTCIPIVDLGPPSIDGHVLNSALPIRYYLKIHLPNYPAIRQACKICLIKIEQGLVGYL